MKNRLVVFEGIDGVGKSSLAREFKKLLKKKGIPAILYEEYEKNHPNFNSLKTLAKKLPITGSNLFYLSSAFYKSEIIKKLLRNSWVICDRYFYSTMAYHLARGSKVKMELTKEILKPDYGFLIVLDEGIRRKRVYKKKLITEADLVKKTPGSLPYKMETYLKKMKLIQIDNSKDLQEALSNIMLKIFRKSF